MGVDFFYNSYKLKLGPPRAFLDTQNSKFILMFAKLINHLREVKIELKKVNWPSKKETLRLTLVVIGVSLTTALFLGALDFIFARVLNTFVL